MNENIKITDKQMAMTGAVTLTQGLGDDSRKRILEGVKSIKGNEDLAALFPLDQQEKLMVLGQYVRGLITMSRRGAQFSNEDIAREADRLGDLVQIPVEVRKELLEKQLPGVDMVELFNAAVR